MIFDWIKFLEDYKKSVYRDEPGSNHYFFKDRSSDTLCLVIGDSWTWGDSLEPSKRLDQVYGNLISESLISDWINIGCPGWSNSWILLNTQQVVTQLVNNKKYKKIYVIITLTENGRDIATGQAYRYDYLNTHQIIGTSCQFYDTILNDIEDRWANQIQDLLNISDDRYIFFIGQNFVWHNQLKNKLNNTRLIFSDLNWIECLADYQHMSRPIRTNLVTGRIFVTISKVNDIIDEKNLTIFKKWSVDKIEKALQVNEWLDSSPINYKKASKHPNAVGHLVWANHIINQIKQYI